jgi:hypothetical protein
MLRNGRPEDQDFGPAEHMYRRYIKDDFEGEYFKPARFRFPPSLNRQRYSEPEDVIFSERGEFDGCGILECTVQDLSLHLTDDRNMEYHFMPVHVPEEHNYSHSEVWASFGEPPALANEPTKIAKKKYRTVASKFFKIRTPATR